jgi:hypothetical protein
MQEEPGKKRIRSEKVTPSSLAEVDTQMQQDPFAGPDPFAADPFEPPAKKKQKIAAHDERAAPAIGGDQQQDFPPMGPLLPDVPMADIVEERKTPPIAIALKRPPLPFRPRVQDVFVPMPRDPFEIPPVRDNAPHQLAPDTELAAAIGASGIEIEMAATAASSGGGGGDGGAAPAAAYTGPLPPPLRSTNEQFRAIRTGQYVSKDQFDALNEIFDVYNAFNEYVLCRCSLSRALFFSDFVFLFFRLSHRSLSAAKSVLTKLMQKPFFQRAFVQLRPKLAPLGITQISDFRSITFFSSSFKRWTLSFPTLFASHTQDPRGRDRSVARAPACSICLVLR